MSKIEEIQAIDWQGNVLWVKNTKSHPEDQIYFSSAIAMDDKRMVAMDPLGQITVWSI